ncbi:MAG: hypothetical protein ACE5FL_12950 [Myxococcota bacterium]
MLRHRIGAWTTAAALALLAFCEGFKKIRNPDYWWHLSTGQWIANTGSVPTADPFTYTVPGAPWIDIHWLFQLGLEALHGIGGHDGVVVVKAVASVVLVAILATVGWRPERPYLTAFGLGSMLLIAGERFLARPEMASFLLLAAILALLERNERRDDAWVYAVVPLQLVWVNLHGLFALGVAICGFYLLSDAIRSRQATGRARPSRRLLKVTALVALASFANPNFVDGALYPFEQFVMIGPTGDRGIPGRSVIELRPVWDPKIPAVWLVLPAVLCLVGIVAQVANWRANRSRVAHALIFSSFLLLALQANRNLALFAIVAAPLTIRNASEWLDRHPPPVAAGRWATAALTLALLLASFDVARNSFYARMRTVHETGLGTVDVFLPEGAVDWIERERPPGRIAHQMALGGYVNWRLYPDYQVMVDGRLEVFGPEMLGALAFTTPRAFRRLDASYYFGSVLLSPSFDPAKFIAWMNQNPDWRLVYADMGGLLFVRIDARGSPQWPAVDVAAPDLLPEMKSGSRGMDQARRKARMVLFAGLGQMDRAQAELGAVTEP